MKFGRNQETNDLVIKVSTDGQSEYYRVQSTFVGGALMKHQKHEKAAKEIIAVSNKCGDNKVILFLDFYCTFLIICYFKIKINYTIFMALYRTKKW